MFNPPVGSKNGKPTEHKRGLLEGPSQSPRAELSFGNGMKPYRQPKHRLPPPASLSPPPPPSHSIPFLPSLYLCLSLPLSSAHLCYSFAHCKLVSSEAWMMDNDSKHSRLYTRRSIHPEDAPESQGRDSLLHLISNARPPATLAREAEFECTPLIPASGWATGVASWGEDKPSLIGGVQAVCSDMEKKKKIRAHLYGVIPR